MQQKKIKLGIGFATGRKSFRKVLKSYIFSWKESGLFEQMKDQVSLNLFIAYDLAYSNTQSTDFTNLSQEMVDAFDDIVFLGSKNAQREVLHRVQDGSLSQKDARLLFGTGYAGKRNAIMFAALDREMDYILYLDDDEYPVAVTNNRGICLWSGQYVLPMHMQNIGQADITNGFHCGYISPIPQIDFNSTLSEQEFARFIGAISNDIISWESIRKKMERGGVTYADTDILQANTANPVTEVNHCKFISGSNLCINLTKPMRTFPFFNPPGARGEDTFMSTLLTDRLVLRIPCYTFHDGFSSYRHLLDGVLPTCLEPISPETPATVSRFLAACIGWIRYKPLLLYITAPETYGETIAQMRTTLQQVLPSICRYFEQEQFMQILDELDKYDHLMKKHHTQFLEVQAAWAKVLSLLRGKRLI